MSEPTAPDPSRAVEEMSRLLDVADQLQDRVDSGRTKLAASGGATLLIMSFLAGMMRLSTQPREGVSFWLYLISAVGTIAAMLNTMVLWRRELRRDLRALNAVTGTLRQEIRTLLPTLPFLAKTELMVRLSRFQIGPESSLSVELSSQPQNPGPGGASRPADVDKDSSAINLRVSNERSALRV
jgi:hypothetical protein